MFLLKFTIKNSKYKCWKNHFLAKTHKLHTPIIVFRWKNCDANSRWTTKLNMSKCSFQRSNSSKPGEGGTWRKRLEMRWQPLAKFPKLSYSQPFTKYFSSASMVIIAEVNLRAPGVISYTQFNTIKRINLIHGCAFTHRLVDCNDNNVNIKHLSKL